MIDQLREVKSILFRHSKHGIVEAPNGWFICPLPGGPLRYLHKVYSPRDEGIGAIEEGLWHPLPPDYLTLLRFCDGATLYDNSLFIHGSRANRARSLKLEDQTGLSIFDEIENMKIGGVGPGQSGLAPVGSVAASTEVFFLYMRQDGQVLFVRGNGATCIFDSALSCVHRLVNQIDTISDHRGLFDSSKEQLQEEMIALCSSE